MLTYVTQYITLLPGDLFITGTPAGVGPVKDGDEIIASMVEGGKEVARIQKRVSLKGFEEAKL